MTADERADASARICEAAGRVLAGAAGAIALYAPKGSEVDTVALDEQLRASGRVVVYPRVGGGRVLSFHAVAIDALEPSRFGLREPSTNAPSIAVAAIAAFVVPGVAFARDGSRIGWGGGHYDSTLAIASPNALRIGLAYECQLVDDVPSEPHDIQLHHVITEVAIYPS
jgi:5-formyltetrahydrofolate cyclo-ligase